MTPERQQLLAELLREVATTSEPDRPAGFIPDVALSAFHKLAANGVLELIIYRPRNGYQYEYYYQERNDKDWQGFAVVGAFVKSNFPQDPVSIAQKILDREFAGLGITVSTLQVVAPLLWKREHPWANPFVTTCVVEVTGQIPEGQGRWVAVGDLDSLSPDPVVHHADYLRQADYFMRHGALIFTPTQRMGVPGLEVPAVSDHPNLGNR